MFIIRSAGREETVGPLGRTELRRAAQNIANNRQACATVMTERHTILFIVDPEGK